LDVVGEHAVLRFCLAAAAAIPFVDRFTVTARSVENCFAPSSMLRG
jgi:hypothetical protein